MMASDACDLVLRLQNCVGGRVREGERVFLSAAAGVNTREDWKTPQGDIDGLSE